MIQDKDVARFTIDLPKSLHKELKKICVENDVSMKQIILSIVENFIAQSNER